MKKIGILVLVRIPRRVLHFWFVSGGQPEISR